MPSADPRVTSRVMRVARAAKDHPDQLDDCQRDLAETKITIAGEEFIARWPGAWPELVVTLAQLHRGGGDGT